MQRINMNRDQTPNFIGGWYLDQPDLCEKIIDFFEGNPSMHEAGSTFYGVDVSRKNSIDLVIRPKDLRNPTHAIFKNYLQELHRCFIDYLDQWPFLNDPLKEVDIGAFNIQKYRVGGHFSKVHTERASVFTMHRALVWMTYLNDVEEGGHTHFAHYGLDVKPERGKTLIWPTDWTHAHTGNLVTAGVKYIVTGWMHYPIVRHFTAVDLECSAPEEGA
jgi:hypothetical protein